MAYALIAAGGSGTRFGDPRPKQYALLAGLPILTRTLLAFDRCDAISHIVLVVPENDTVYCRESIVKGAGLQKEITIAAGGDSRQESVRRGLALTGEDDAIVAIHDAVRPLVALDSIRSCVHTACRHEACVVAVPAWDTLKRATPSGDVLGTLPREGVWLAQTPQAFRVGLIRAAHAKALREGYLGTDDASLVERMGKSVRLIAGSRTNLKITTAEDLKLADAFLSLQQSESNRTA